MLGRCEDALYHTRVLSVLLGATPAGKWKRSMVVLHAGVHMEVGAKGLALPRLRDSGQGVRGALDDMRGADIRALEAGDRVGPREKVLRTGRRCRLL